MSTKIHLPISCLGGDQRCNTINRAKHNKRKLRREERRKIAATRTTTTCTTITVTETATCTAVLPKDTRQYSCKEQMDSKVVSALLVEKLLNSARKQTDANGEVVSNNVDTPKFSYEIKEERGLAPSEESRSQMVHAPKGVHKGETVERAQIQTFSSKHREIKDASHADTVTRKDVVKIKNKNSELVNNEDLRNSKGRLNNKPYHRLESSGGGLGLWKLCHNIERADEDHVENSPIKGQQLADYSSFNETKETMHASVESLPDTVQTDPPELDCHDHPAITYALWGPLTESQRLHKILTSPSVNPSTVEASLQGLTPSERVRVLCQWLKTATLSYPRASEIWTNVIAQAWKLIVELVGEEALEEVKYHVEYDDLVEPRLAEWNKRQVRKLGLERRVEEVWGPAWRAEFPIMTIWSELMLVKMVELAVSFSNAQEGWAWVRSNVGCNDQEHMLVCDVEAALRIRRFGDGTKDVESHMKQCLSYRKLPCGCPFSLYSIVSKLPRPKSCSTLLPQASAESLLRQIHSVLPEPKSFSAICHSHLRRLAGGTFGLLNNVTDHALLSSRLTHLFKNPNPKLPHTHLNPSWFRKNLRQTSNIRAELGLYKFAVRNPMSVTKAFSKTASMKGIRTFTFDRETVFARFSSPGKFEEYQLYGTVRIPDLFAHLNRNIMSSEFEIYRHHFHPPPGTKPMGWLRIMYHSLTQQAIRQDPGLYALHAAAREDGCWRLISYPYYTKDTSANGEKTGFKHFDMNVGNYLGAEGIGRNVVQSAVTVSEKDETTEGCTVLVPGFHKHIHEWWAKRKKDTPTGGETTNIIPGKNWTKQDDNDYGPFIPYPCRVGETRITRPDIPHGSTPLSKETRRVVFPWFIGIRDDHETLDVSTTETWSQLAACHRDLTACYKSTSGRSASAYGRPNFRWPAAVRMASTSCIGDALVGRRRWDDPEVVYERDFLLTGGPDRDGIVQDWLQGVRERVNKEFERCWEVVKRVEREEFGDVAFWRVGGWNGQNIAADGDDHDENLDLHAP